METSSTRSRSIARVLGNIVAQLSSGWLMVLADLYILLRQWWSSQQSQGLYQILDYETTLELKDRQGETAVLNKRQRVKFIQDQTIAFQDYAWGDGECLADYKCSPGVVVDRYQEGDRWNILISLRETKSRGDIEEFYIERTVQQAFTKAEEWWQVEIRHHTRRLKMTVIFPKGGRCQRAILLQRSRHRTTVLGPEHFSDRPDGRQSLTWESENINRFEIFTIKWKW